MIQWAFELPGLRLGLGDCADYDGDADFVFTDLYGPLPTQLLDKPMIINLIGKGKWRLAQRWIGGRELIQISEWEPCNHVYVVNMEVKPVDLSDLEPDHGFFPLALPMRLLSAFGPPWKATVYDGCMGRGTVGKAALELGYDYVGVDINPKRVEMAVAYLAGN